MYYYFLTIAVLAFIFNIFFITQSSQSKSEVGVAPVVQLVFIIPIFVLSSLIFYFFQNTNFGINHRGLFLLLPFVLEMLYFAYTKDLFAIHKADTSGFLIRSYFYSICLATIVGGLLRWIFG
jgi:hypothetical protein